MDMRHTLTVGSVEERKILTATFYSLSECYRNFCGIFFDIKLNDNSKLGMENIIDDIKAELYLSQKDRPESKESIDIFFEFELWELQLGVLYCLEDEKVKKDLLEKFAYNEGLDARLRSTNGSTIEYMQTYIRYLILCINTSGEDAIISSKDLVECHNLTNYCVRKMQMTNNISYQFLLCKVCEKYKTPVEVEEHYSQLLDSIRRNPNDNKNVLSMAYYDFSRYLEKLSAVQGMRLGAKIKIESYYEQALLIDPDNYKAYYKLIFYKKREKDQDYYKIQALKDFILKLNELTNQEGIRIYLYLFKAHYNLGILYKQIGESKKALDYFVSAEEIYHRLIEPIWNCMGMGKDDQDSKQALLNYLNMTLLYHQRVRARFDVEDEQNVDQ